MDELKKAIKHFKKVDPVLAELIKRLGLLPERKVPRNHFKTLCSSIISQQLSTKAAATIFKRFRALYQGKAFPKPEDILKTSDKKLREAGLSYQKISYLKDLSDHVINKKLHLTKLNKMSNEDVVAELVAVKGIGQWTAEMFLMFSLHRPDVFSYGDLGLKNALIKLYKLPKSVSQKQLERIVEPWAPYRTYAARYLWRSLDNE